MKNNFDWMNSLRNGLCLITLILAMVMVSYYLQLKYDLYISRNQSTVNYYTNGDTIVEWGTYNYIVNTEENPARAQIELDDFNKQYDVVTITGKLTNFSEINNKCAHMEVNNGNNSILFYLDIEDMVKLNIGDIITIKGKFDAEFSYVSIGKLNKPAELISVK